MFIWSFRMSKRELIIIGVGLLIFIGAMIAIIGAAGSDSASAYLGGSFTDQAADEEERIAFLRQFGWEVEKEPVEVKEVSLPKTPDSRFAEYNELQLRQGFDLSGYQGQRVKLWTYRVTNYPAGGKVLANMLILDGKVIGGDISSSKLDGFSHGFDPSLFAAETAEAQAQSSSVDRTVPDRIPEHQDAPTEEQLEGSDQD